MSAIRLNLGNYVSADSYLTDAGQWFGDEQADDHEPNEFGDQNCVLDLAPISVPA